MEITKVEDLGPTILVTLRISKKTSGYYCSILDNLDRISRQINRKARIATAERRALQRAHQIGPSTDPKQIRNEMILFLKENGWKVEAIAEAYQVSPGNVRQILSRLKKEKP